MRVRALSFWINPDTGDIEVDRETGHISLATGTDEVEQAVRRRLSTWEGEWFWNGKFGMPWHKFIGKNVDLGMLQLELIRELAKEKRIERLLAAQVAGYDPHTRRLTVVFAGAFRNDIVKAVLNLEV